MNEHEGKKNEDQLIVAIGNELSEVALNSTEPIDKRAIAYIDVYRILYPNADKSHNHIPPYERGYIGYLLGEVSKFTYHQYGIFLSSLVCYINRPHAAGKGYFQMVDEIIRIPIHAQLLSNKEKRELVKSHQLEVIKKCEENPNLFNNFSRP